jgi:transcriptional regulator with XRE-family HTH domain
MDFKSAREKKGLTLEKAAEISGYSIAAINGLENHGEGSGRLRSKLGEIYGLLPPPTPIHDLSRTAASNAAFKNMNARLDREDKKIAELLRARAQKYLDLAAKLDPRARQKES